MWLGPDGTLLTYNLEVRTDDPRFSVEHPYLQEWNLRIDNVKLGDAGTYKCMISTSPPTEKQVQLEVTCKSFMIL